MVLLGGGIEDLAVAPAARRRGHGRALLEAAIQELPGSVGSDVFLSVDAEAAGAIRLYRALGFAETLRSVLLEKSWASPVVVATGD